MPELNRAYKGKCPPRRRPGPTIRAGDDNGRGRRGLSEHIIPRSPTDCQASLEWSPQMRRFRARALQASNAGDYDQAAIWLDKFYKLKRAQVAGEVAAP